MHCVKNRIRKRVSRFSNKLEQQVKKDIQIVTISRPTAYGEYEPYHFVHSYDEFESRIKSL